MELLMENDPRFEIVYVWIKKLNEIQYITNREQKKLKIKRVNFLKKIEKFSSYALYFSVCAVLLGVFDGFIRYFQLSSVYHIADLLKIITVLFASFSSVYSGLQNKAAKVIDVNMIERFNKLNEDLNSVNMQAMRGEFKDLEFFSLFISRHYDEFKKVFGDNLMIDDGIDEEFYNEFNKNCRDEENKKLINSLKEHIKI
jgi:hypothetical protein